MAPLLEGSFMESCLVTQNIFAAMIDGADPDRNPDAHPAQGMVLLTPMLGEGDTVRHAGDSVALAPIEARVQSGRIMHRGQVGVRVPHVEGLPWRASYSGLQANGWPFKMRSFSFSTVADGVVDLGEWADAQVEWPPLVVSRVAGLVSDAELAAAAAWEAVDTPGRQGPPGAAVSIVSQLTLPDNSVQVTFSDDSVLTVPAGLQGVPGEPGDPGLNGVDGVDGIDGELSPEDRALVVAATGHAADAAQSAADALVSAGMAEDRAQAAAQSAADAAESVTSGLADGSVTRVKLAAEVTDELDGKAPVVHEHTMAQISDLPEVSVLPTGGALAKRGVSGGVLVPITPADPADATSKSYVDAAVAGAGGAVSSVNAQTGDVVLDAADVGAAPASHTHVIGDVGGLSTALDGKASAAHTHTVASLSDSTAVGRSVVVASSAAAARAAIGAGTSSLALGAGAGEAAAGNHSHTAESVGAAPATHTHVVAEITDLPEVAQQATAGALVQRRGNSQITVPEVPSDPSDAVAKSYVDGRIQLVTELPSVGAPGVLYVIAEA